MVYLLVGFFLVPALVKWQLQKQLPVATHRRAAVRQVKCNPLALSLTIRGLALTETNGQPFVSFEEFYGNFQLSSLFRWAWTFDEISLREPRVNLVLNPDGRFNFANLLESPTNAPPPKPETKRALPGLLVFNLMLTNGHVAFADLSRHTPFRTVYEPINLTLQRFTTKADRHSPYSFRASGDGGRSIAWAGTITAQPLASTGTLQVIGAQLPKHAPYLEGFTRARLTEGTLDVAGRYAFAQGTNGTDLIASDVELTLHRLEIRDSDTNDVVLAIPSLQVRNAGFDLRARQARVGSLAVSDPASLVRRRPDGSINLLALLVPRATPPRETAPDTAPPSPAPAGPPWVFALDEANLRGGAVQVEDATVPGPFRSVLKPVTVHVQHFSTATNAETALQVAVTTEAGESVNLASSCSINPVRGTNALKLAGIELKKYQPYLAPFFRGSLAAGKVDMTLESSQELNGGQLQATVTNAVVKVSDLELLSFEGGEKVATIPSFTIENASLNLAEKAIHVQGVKSGGTTVNARREADGTLSLLSLIAPRTTPGAGTNAPAAATQAPSAGTNAPPAPSTQESRVTLDELALRDWTLHLADRQLPKPGELDLEQFALTLKGVQFPSNAPVAVELSTRVNGAGAVAIRGTIHPYSPAVEADVGVAGMELRGFQPWIDPHLKIEVQSGAFHTTGRVEYAATDRDSPKLQFKGALGVTNLVTLDQVLRKEFVRWDDFAIQGLDLDAGGRKATVEQVKFAGLKTSLIIGPDKRPNVLTVLPRPPATNGPPPAPPPTSVPESTPTAAPAPGETFSMELGELKLEKTAVHFSDQSVQPACTFDVQQLDGTVRGLSTRPDSAADVDLTGRVDEASSFALRGRVNPLARDLTLDLVFTNGNLQLTPFTPYLEKYAGYPLHKGRLSLDLHYAVQAKELKAENKVAIEQLMLGPRNDNPDASKLPVKLAVALLKDSNGRIDLDLPLTGRIDDPQFRIGPVILKVVVNLIVKAAASPFKLIGALVGGGEELSFVAFEPGAATLLETETKKLDQLVQALEKRPALNLEIEGSMDPKADRDALARGLVRERARLQRRQELSAIGQAPSATESLPLDPAEYERLLRAFVVQTYGTNLTDALHTLAEQKAGLTNAASSSPHRAEGPGFFTRVGSLFKPAKERAATRQAYRAAKADARLREQNPELAQLAAEDMETLLAAKTEVPGAQLQQLMQERAKAVQAYFLSSGKVAADRLFLVAPKTPDAGYQGEARVHLSLN